MIASPVIPTLVHSAGQLFLEADRGDVESSRTCMLAEGAREGGGWHVWEEEAVASGVGAHTCPEELCVSLLGVVTAPRLCGLGNWIPSPSLCLPPNSSRVARAELMVLMP